MFCPSPIYSHFIICLMTVKPVGQNFQPNVYFLFFEGVFYLPPFIPYLKSVDRTHHSPAATHIPHPPTSVLILMSQHFPPYVPTHAMSKSMNTDKVTATELRTSSKLRGATLNPTL